MKSPQNYADNHEHVADRPGRQCSKALAPGRHSGGLGFRV